MLLLLCCRLSALHPLPSTLPLPASHTAITVSGQQETPALKEGKMVVAVAMLQGPKAIFVKCKSGTNSRLAAQSTPMEPRHKGSQALNNCPSHADSLHDSNPSTTGAMLLTLRPLANSDSHHIPRAPSPVLALVLLVLQFWHCCVQPVCGI